MELHPPGYRNLSTYSKDNCRSCSYFSQAYGGFCTKYNQRMGQDLTICDDFLARGYVYCAYCGAPIKENSVKCPHCQADLMTTPADGMVKSGETGIDTEKENLLRIHKIFQDTTSYSPKFEQKYRIWKQYLLDLSNRNFQLNFRPHSNRTVEIISPSLGNIFQLLVGEEKRLHFLPVFNPDSIIHKKNTEDAKDEYEKTVHQMYEKALFKILESPPPDKLIGGVNDKELERRLARFASKNDDFLEEKGVNALFFTFGLLKWQENGSNSPNSHHFSPILFVPVRVSRVSVKKLHSVEILDENIFFNPSLRHKLKIDHQLEFPEFKGEYSKQNVLGYFDQLSNVVKDFPAWEITYRTFISFFAFNKIPLFQDLYDYKPLYYNHPFIHHLAELSRYPQNIDISQLSEEQTHNERAINAFSILDIDHSQLQAVSYVEQGYSCIIRGPPGTGKSQCISNIISECLSDGKTVLFVAQKSVALDVVKKRLDKTGVGEFCLELHSDKSNKRKVMDQIRHTYNTELRPFNVPNEKYNTLNRLENRLTEYIKEINAPIPPENHRVEQFLADLDGLREIDFFNSYIPNVETISSDHLERMADIFDSLENYPEIITNYENFPWRLTSLNQPPEHAQKEIQKVLFQFKAQLQRFQEQLTIFSQRYGIYQPNYVQDMQELSEFFSKYASKTLWVNVEQFIQVYDANFESFRKFYKPAYLAFRKRVLHKIAPKKGNRKFLHTHLKYIQQIQHKFLKDNSSEVRKTMEVSQLDAVESEFNQLLQSMNQLMNLKDHPILVKLPILPVIQQKKASYWENLAEWCDFWLEKLDFFNDWLQFSNLIQQLKDNQLELFVSELISTKITSNLAARFRKTYLVQWLIWVFHSSNSLSAFNRDKYEKWAERFGELDAELLKINRYRLAERLFKHRPIAPWLYQTDESNEIGFLNRELIKRRNIKPLREILSVTRDYILTLKPCLLMSPLSIATYLPMEDFYQYFDLVIFDEASQVCTEDAIGAIVRGKQVVIVGDERQLPPTRFFTSQLFNNDSDSDSDSDSSTDFDEYDSILEEAMAMELPIFTLKNHYRSKREDLIVFSNHKYYDSMLNTFPDIFLEEGNYGSGKDQENENKGSDISHQSAIAFHYIQNGLYDRGKTRTNKIEADEVARAIIEHYSKNSGQSLGVIAFNEAQMEAVEKALAKKLKENPDQERFIDFTGPERLLIKNIENIQGNERDVIFFSIGYGYDDEGIFRLNFGALNQMGGERRLNVAITRARYRMEIFCSFNPFKIDYQRTQSIGVRDFFHFLQFAYTHSIQVLSSKLSMQTSLDFYTDLQKSIAGKLEALGFKVDIGVGKSNNRLDLAIVHPFDPTRYVLGIYLDHGSFANAPNCTERFRIRPSVLISLGWDLYHLYSVEWMEDHQKILEEIKERVYQICTLEKNKPSPSHSKKASPSSSVPSSADFYQISELDVMSLANSRWENSDFRKKVLKIPGVQEYRKFTFTEGYTTEEFHNPSFKREIIRSLKKIVAVEGPIHFDLAVSRMSELFGYKRKSKYVERILTDLIFSQDIVDHKSEPGFLHLLKSQKAQTSEVQSSFMCRLTLHPKDDPRKFYMISGLEIAKVIIFLLKNGGKMNRDTLQSTVMNIFGKKSSSSSAEEHFQKVLEKLVRNKKVHELNNIFWVDK